MNEPIQFDGVERRFGASEVLRGLSFAVRPGEVYALLGRNGAGKTTALRILLGFLQPLSGRARLLGCDSERLTPALRERVGLVSEGQRLYGALRLREVLAFEAGTRRAFDRELARRVLARLELPLELRVRQLSRGMRAQLALVLAVACRPEVLVLDDPGLGLDAAARRELLDALIELLGRDGCSVLFTSHVLSDVERVADRVGFLHQGRLRLEDSVHALPRRAERRVLRSRIELGESLAHTPGLLRARRVAEGYELSLLDAGAERLRELSALGELSEPIPLDLEQLFLELTSEGREAALVAELAREPMEVVR